MPRSDTYTLKRVVFGDQFDLLACKLVDRDPVERTKALSVLERYLDDCTTPLLELKKEIAAAVREAKRSHEGQAADESSARLLGQAALTRPARNLMSRHEREIAAIEDLVAAPPSRNDL